MLVLIKYNYSFMRHEEDTGMRAGSLISHTKLRLDYYTRESQLDTGVLTEGGQKDNEKQK